MKKTTLLIIAIVLTRLVQAQDKTNLNFTFDHIALSVKDMNLSAEFYKTVFQLPEITNRTANPTIRWISMNDGKELHLITNSEPVKINKTIHLAFSTADLAAFQKHLDKLKIPYGDWAGNVNQVTTRADGIKQIYLQDPDGYWIEINNTREKK